MRALAVALVLVAPSLCLAAAGTLPLHLAESDI